MKTLLKPLFGALILAGAVMTVGANNFAMPSNAPWGYTAAPQRCCTDPGNTKVTSNEMPDWDGNNIGDL